VSRPDTIPLVASSGLIRARPKRVRDKFGLETGDELTVNLVDQKIILRKSPKSYTDYMWGLHRDSLRGVDAGEHVDGERESWWRRG